MAMRKGAMKYKLFKQSFKVLTEVLVEEWMLGLKSWALEYESQVSISQIEEGLMSFL